MFKQFLDKASILQTLEPLLTEFEEEVIPCKVELLANNTYALNYAWMYSYEKKLKYKIQQILGFKFSYDQEKILFGAGGAVSEALSNAFVHGHKKDNAKPIALWVAVAKKGLGFEISDSGNGFDFNEILKNFKRGTNFFHIAGNGFALFHRSQDVMAWYHNGGKQLCILYTFA